MNQTPGEANDVSTQDAPLVASVVQPPVERVSPAERKDLCLEVACVAVGTLIADLWIFRGRGFAATAAFLTGFLALICLRRFLGTRPESKTQPTHRKVAGAVVIGLLLLVIGRLLWQGSALTVASGFILLVGWTVTTSGGFPMLRKCLRRSSAASVSDWCDRLAIVTCCKVIERRSARHQGHTGGAI